MADFVFFFNDTATTDIYTLSLHDALPIWEHNVDVTRRARRGGSGGGTHRAPEDRKSTRLNSSHANSSYAVFCLKKKNLIRAVLVAIVKVGREHQQRVVEQCRTAFVNGLHP